MPGQRQVQGADPGGPRTIRQFGIRFETALGSGDSQAGDVDFGLLLRLPQVDQAQSGFEVYLGIVAGVAAFGNKQSPRSITRLERSTPRKT